MAKYTYTYENIIIDPSKECIKNIIGKDVYFNNNPSLCLAGANEKSTVSLGVLVEIHKDSITPFVVERNDTDLAYSCIIVKKEEPKPKYVPFESKEEFVRRYTEVKEGADFDTFEDNLFQCGMWLRCKENGGLFQVVGFLNDAVYLNIRAFDTNYQRMLNDFEFLDGTPCGKEVEDE